MFSRRDFLKSMAALVAPLVVKPLPVFVPPREPYVQLGRKSLDGLYSHLGVLPSTNELSICEGVLLDIDGWDGTGYPCLVENACTFGPNPPRAWIYDFDLWNFRHDDEFGPLWKRPEYAEMNSHAEWHARRRFGDSFDEIVTKGGGSLVRRVQKRWHLERRITEV